MNSPPHIVGIAGASASGKTRLANRLFEALSDDAKADVSILSEDGYYRCNDNLSFEQREKINYDHPDAFEHELLIQHLKQLKNGEGIEVPQYNYADHNRSSETISFRPTRWIILEGILIFHQPQLRSHLDLKVFVDVAMDVCLARRIRRDTQERKRSVESVLTQYEQTVRPMFHQFVEPTKAYADLIVPYGDENKMAVEVIANHLRQL